MSVRTPNGQGRVVVEPDELVPLVPEPIPEEPVAGELAEPVAPLVLPLVSVDPVELVPGLLPVLPVPELMPEDVPLVPVDDVSVDDVPVAGDVLLVLSLLIEPVEELEGELVVDDVDGVVMVVMDGVVTVVVDGVGVVVVVVVDVPEPDRP